LTPQQIADLSRRGHSVSNHTYSHVNLATLPESQLHHEIVDSAAQIASWTGQPVDAFAWTFSWDSITPAARKLIQQHHRFCFAPCPGSVDCRTDSQNLIWRTEVEVVDPRFSLHVRWAGGPAVAKEARAPESYHERHTPQIGVRSIYDWVKGN
jgi:peptidoglycan/xylan/chitin deacetylase (PgdA/CDA1 family)